MINSILSSKNCIFFVFISIFFLIEPGNAQINCNPSIRANKDVLLPYSNWGNRCEGFYSAQVGGSLQLVGFTKGNLDFKLVNDEIVSITGPVYDQSDIIIQVLAIPLKTYYRMDAKISAGTNEVFQWPLNAVIIPSGTLTSKDLGLTGYVELEGKKYYIPLRAVSNQVENIVNKDYNFVFRSTKDLTLLQYQLFKENDRSPDKKKIPLPVPTQYEGKPIIISFSTLAPGKYILILFGKGRYSDDWDNKKVYIEIPLDSDRP